MSDAVDAARARIAAGEAEVAAGRADLVAAMGELANDGWTVERVAAECGVSFATAKNAIAEHRKTHPKPVDPRPPLRDRSKPRATALPLVPPRVVPPTPELNPNRDEVDF